MKAKKLLATLTCAALLASPTAALAESTDLTLIVGTEIIGYDEAAGEPYINDSGRTMIPLRLVNTKMGYTTDWQSDGSISIKSADGTVDVQLKIGSKEYVAGGESGTFGTAPTLKNNRTYLPARDFSELYGNIYWEGVSRTVWITQGDKVDYRGIGGKVLVSDEEGIRPLALPEGYAIDTNPVKSQVLHVRTIDGVTYLSIKCLDRTYAEPVPLFRVDGDNLIYVADIFGSTDFIIDGDTLYYTDGSGADAWQNPIEPNRLYIHTIGGDTQTVTLDFAVNNCLLSMEDGQLVATERNGGGSHVIALDS